MTTKLRELFPMIRTRHQVMAEIRDSPKLSDLFETWTKEQQSEFLDFCTGARGVKMLYDSFFKEIFNPDTVPERLDELLSLILGQKVRILMALPNESNRIADEGSLLILDIVVRLEDGSLANLECQKIGYAFPGERAACYSADLLMRQYRRVKCEKQKRFSYRDIKKVYSIIFYETSPKGFRKCHEHYIHRSSQKTDTKVEINLLQEYVFISLDIFLQFHHNKGIRNQLEAWLTFLGYDNPEDIIALIEQYPRFQELYRDVYDMCRNTERVMGMFSKELKTLDQNTVSLMLDEMQAEIDANAAKISEQETKLNEKDAMLNEKDAMLNEKDAELNEKDTMLNEQKQMIAALKAELEKLRNQEA